MSTPPKAFVVLAGEGTTVRGPAGGPTTIKGTRRGHRRYLRPPGEPDRARRGSAAACPRRRGEMWYVLDGNFRFGVDERILDAPAGSFVFVPRGTARCLQNISDAPARLMVLFVRRAWNASSRSTRRSLRAPWTRLRIWRSPAAMAWRSPARRPLGPTLSESDQRGSALPAV